MMKKINLFSGKDINGTIKSVARLDMNQMMKIRGGGDDSEELGGLIRD
jgi:hypothetical protein